MKLLLSVAILVAAFGAAHAEGPPPALVKVADVSAKDKSISIEQVVSKCVPFTVQKTVEFNGRKQVVTATEVKTVCESHNVTRSLKEATAYDGGGSKLTESQMWQRLKAGEVVVMATDTLPNGDFMKVLRKDALVLVLPTSAMMPAAVPAPPVPAPPGVVPQPAPSIPAIPIIPAPPSPRGRPTPPPPTM